MACFSSFFWSRRKEESAALTSSDTSPWFISGVEPRRILPPAQVISRQIHASFSSKSLCDDLLSDLRFLSCDKRFEIGSRDDSSTEMSFSRGTNDADDTRVRGVVSDATGGGDSMRLKQVAPVVSDADRNETADVAGFIGEEDSGSKSPDSLCRRYRRTGVYTFSSSPTSDKDLNEASRQPEQTSKKYDLPETDNEKLLAPPASGYCSSAASAGSEDESDKLAPKKNLVRRCESSDSAIVHSDEESTTVHSNWGEKNEDIDEVPYRYPVFSPYSPRRSIDHENVPSRTLLEAQFVALPLDRKASDAFSELSDIFTDDSRRQSCFTDDGDEISKYRYWRTPSVVVSDYSDDPMGLTLEDIEYIRNRHQDNGSSPDSSLHSSCSNLNLVGSNPDTYRKVSDCSTCSFSGDEDADYSREVSAIFYAESLHFFWVIYQRLVSSQFDNATCELRMET